VTWFGRLISFLDLRLNRATDPDALRRQRGVQALLAIVLVPAVIGLCVQLVLLWFVPMGLIIGALLATSLLSQKSLYEHVEAVADALDSGGLTMGRV
ncbi:cobalamin biosynthesis protein, partial [Mesorhizobium sp. M4B.F.Ca.ET.200.01.1.1]|uniref:cobalamin biosynthesis protein n=1 Tax=Mesorhizobium sp. M4B.F.Ca.ET.200.01.1.1 TaxID=2563952 RepID=UPI00113AAA9B